MFAHTIRKENFLSRNKILPYALFLLLTFVLFPRLAFAGDGNEILKKKCAKCHDLKGPSATTVEDLWKRKAPDLFYSGLKYNADWLETWLINPTRIRPAGYNYFKNLTEVDGKADVINKKNLKKHIHLSKKEAVEVRDALMSLRTGKNRIIKNGITKTPIDMDMAEMNFNKFSGCIACHRIAPDYGGVTGPEVYTLGERLQPDFIYSYIKNPQAWSPKAPMPNGKLSEEFTQTLVKFMIALAGENK